MILIQDDQKWVGQYFQAKEFKCPCCGINAVHPRLVLRLDKIRAEIGVPLRISSGVRCPAHNANVGGATNSYHMPQEDAKGWAADFTFARHSMKIPINMVKLYLTACEQSVANGGVILYPSWVHIDVRPKRYRSTKKFPWPRLA